MPKEKLSPKQERFVEEYLVDGNATKAAIRAGYSAASAYSQAHDLLKKPEIQASLENHNASRSKRTKITADRVLKELGRIGFSSVTNHSKVRALELLGKHLGLWSAKEEEDDRTERWELVIKDYTRRGNEN